MTFCAVGFLRFISENIIYWFPQPYSYVAFLVQDMTFSVTTNKEFEVFYSQEMSFFCPLKFMQIYGKLLRCANLRVV